VALGVSETTLRRLLAEDELAWRSYEEGRARLFAELTDFLLHPKLPEGGSVTERIALMRAKHLGSLATLNALFGWKQPEQPQAAQVNVQISLPGPMSPDQYRATIPGTAERVDDA
jgi:hypothetical protein